MPDENRMFTGRCLCGGVHYTAHIFVGSKAPWFEITDALPQHAEFGE